MNQQRRFKMGQAKSAIGFAVGYGLEGAANYAEATGHTTAAKGLSVTGNILTGAATGAALGSVIPGLGTAAGAGIGAAVAGLKSAFDSLADSARETASAIDKQKSAMMSGQQVDVGIYKFMQGQNDTAALKKKDVAYF